MDSAFWRGYAVAGEAVRQKVSKTIQIASFQR